MVRTRNASAAFPENNRRPIPTLEPPAPNTGNIIVDEPEDAGPPPITGYVATQATLQRDLDGWELARLLDLAMGGALEIKLAPDQFNNLAPDLRRHFRPVSGGGE